MPKLSGKTLSLDTKFIKKYERMRMKTGAKNSKTTWTTISIPRETIDDCVSSWLTATRAIEKNQYVSLIIPSNAEAASLFYPDETLSYTVRVERINGQEKEEKEETQEAQEV